jgi:hypothetical protein
MQKKILHYILIRFEKTTSVDTGYTGKTDNSGGIGTD